jgi:hypothetical protein
VTAQADAFIARTSGFGRRRIAAYRALIDGLVGNGVWAKLDALYVLATLDTTNAVLNLVSPSFTITSNGSPSFTADQGHTGVDSSSTVYLDSGFTPSSVTGVNFVLNSGHISAWSNTNLQSSGSGGAVMGTIGVSSAIQTQIFPWFGGDGNMHVDCNSSGDFISAANAGSANGFWTISRTGATTTTTYRNGSSIATDTSSSTADLSGFTQSLVILARNAPTGVELGDANQIAAASFGGGLTATDAANLYNGLNTYMALLPFGTDLSPIVFSDSGARSEPSLRARSANERQRTVWWS